MCTIFCVFCKEPLDSKPCVPFAMGQLAHSRLDLKRGISHGPPALNLGISAEQQPQTTTYDHTHWRTRDPVRSPIDKPVRAKLVVGSVTTSESLVLYVFVLFA
jgi:hypothetical protein